MMHRLSRSVTLHSAAALLFLVISLPTIYGKITFEKMTNKDYQGTAYYSIHNVSLYECLGWCRDEIDCAAASFSFVVNPLAPVQETTCQLQNETQSRKPSLAPQRSVNTYYLTKIHIRSDNVCNRLWSFESFPNKMLRGLDNAIIYTANKDACLAACLNEIRFTCRSAEFNYVTLECHLSEYDRRSPLPYIDFVDSQGIDYFENACLQSDQMCQDRRSYETPQVSSPHSIVAHYVDLNYYPDKELLVKSQTGCIRACSLETEFVCRSILYIPNAKPGKPNCVLYHVDHHLLPDGAQTFSSPNPLPLLDSGETNGIYVEAKCVNALDGTAASVTSGRPPTVTVHQNTAASLPIVSTESLVSEATDPSCDTYGVCYDVSIRCTDTRIIVYVHTNRPFHGRIYALGRSETCNANIRNSEEFKLDMPLGGQDCNTQSIAGVYTNTVVLQHHNVVLTKADKVYHVRCTYETTSRNVSFGMMPVRDYFLSPLSDPDTLQITSAPEAPLPKIVILGADGREAQTVRIGDKLTFRIEIPENTPYGIFARSCVAMAKDARSTFEIIDEHGCPVDPSIFPHFLESSNALESHYDAFRFTESYGVIFQCNVKYCIGKCEPVVCGVGRENVESWGRRKRSQRSQTTEENDAEEMTLSHEILVLDFGDEAAQKDNLSGNESFSVHETVMYSDRCASRTSILALGVAGSILLVMYVCTVAYFTAQRRNGKILE